MRQLALLLAVGMIVSAAAGDAVLLESQAPGNLTWSGSSGLWQAWSPGIYTTGVLGTPLAGLPDGTYGQGQDYWSIIRDGNLTIDVDLDLAADQVTPDPNDNHMTTVKGPVYAGSYGAYVAEPVPLAGMWTINANVTFRSEAWRMGGNNGGTGVIDMKAGSMIDMLWTSNMPKSASNTCNMTLQMGPNTVAQFGQYFVWGTGNVVMDPTAVIRIVGYEGGSGPVFANDPTSYLSQIVGSGGETPVVQVLAGQGHLGTDAYQIVIPEPATMSLLVLGGLAVIRRRR